MARTSRYKAMMKHKKMMKMRRLQEGEIKKAVRWWIDEVVGPLKLCPFAKKSRVEIFVSNTDDVRTLVREKAEELVRLAGEGDHFRSFLIVAPYGIESMQSLYERVLRESNGLIGGIGDAEPIDDNMKIDLKELQAWDLEPFWGTRQQLFGRFLLSRTG